LKKAFIPCSPVMVGVGAYVKGERDFRIDYGK